jgi:hypothetical protein
MLLAAALAGCAAPPRAGNEVLGQINDVLLKSATDRKVPRAEVTDTSLMPPLAPQAVADATAVEPRFDLSVVNAPPRRSSWRWFREPATACCCHPT